MRLIKTLITSFPFILMDSILWDLASLVNLQTVVFREIRKTWISIIFTNKKIGRLCKEAKFADSWKTLQLQRHQKQLQIAFDLLIFLDIAAPTAMGITLATMGRLTSFQQKCPLDALNHLFLRNILIFFHKSLISSIEISTLLSSGCIYVWE